jgi:hypothetical protein
MSMDKKDEAIEVARRLSDAIEAGDFGALAKALEAVLVVDDLREAGEELRRLAGAAEPQSEGQK